LTGRPRRQFAEVAARKLSNLFAIDVPPILVQRYADALGVTVHFKPSLGIDGFTHRGHRGLHVYLDGGMPWTRQRFTLAHELGHIQLHHMIGRPASLSLDRCSEKEANIFAAELLVPKTLLKRLAFVHDPDELYLVFAVSRSMMDARLREVGLIRQTAPVTRNPLEDTYVRAV